MKILSIIISALFLLGCQKQEKESVRQEADSVILETTDKVKTIDCRHLVLRDSSGEQFATIIPCPAEVSFENDLHVFDKEQYDLFYNKKVSEHPDWIRAPKSTYQDFIGEWVNLILYDDKFYVYRDCIFNRSWQFTDSSFIEYDMDGPYPSLISMVKKQGNNVTFIEPDSVLINMKQIDAKRSIYQLTFASSEEGYYVIPRKKQGMFPDYEEYCPSEE